MRQKRFLTCAVFRLSRKIDHTFCSSALPAPSIVEGSLSKWRVAHLVLAVGRLQFAAWAIVPLAAWAIFTLVTRPIFRSSLGRGGRCQRILLGPDKALTFLVCYSGFCPADAYNQTFTFVSALPSSGKNAAAQTSCMTL